MCCLIGTKDMGQRVLLNELKLIPLIDIFRHSIYIYSVLGMAGKRGDVPLQKQYLRMLCTSEFYAPAFHLLKAGFKAQVHLKEN